MKIVVLDGYTLNPGDLDWDGLRGLGECAFHDRTERQDVLRRAKDAGCVLTNKTVLDGDLMSQLPELRYIGVLATGYNVVDIDGAADRGITVTNVPDYGTPAVAQMVFALLLELTNRVGHHSSTVLQGKWTECPDCCYWDFPIIELSGLTMGIVGYGRIGSAVANLAQSFGMKVLVNDFSRKRCGQSSLSTDVTDKGDGECRRCRHDETNSLPHQHKPW